jgi:class 3 adenylate cyclase
MLTTGAFLSQLEDVPVRALGPVNLRGIADPIDVFAFD